MLATNIGNADRILRVAAGITLLSLGAAGVLGWWGLVGLVPLATGLAGNCPVYSLLGVSTCPRRA